ncbi:MAG TPA: hypothetical protein VG890_02550 [Puia sp.]|nr:hypothetical protein [Puia sp.]
MSNPIKRSVFISTCVVLFSCSSPRTIMHSWVGHTENDLYQRWGKPEKTIDNGHDGRIAVYAPNANDAVRKNAYCDCKLKSSCIPPKTKEYKMAKLFYINSSGDIYAYKIESREKASAVISN